MKKRMLALLLSAALIAGALPAYGAPETEPLPDYGTPGVDYVEGEAIICLDTSRQKAGEAMLQSGSGYQLESLMELDGSSASQDTLLTASGYESAGGQESEETARELILVTADDGLSTPELIRELEKDPAVVFAEPNYLFPTTDLSGDDEAAPSGEEDGFAPETNQDGDFAKTKDASSDASKGFASESAPGFSLENADADASAPTAGEAKDQNGDLTTWQWCFSNPHYPQYTLNAVPLYQAGITGEDVVVAVLDTGVDYTHPDLAPQMWDEGLSYPALTALGGGKYGINTSLGAADSTDPMDNDAHGTHCAGIIASAWNGQGTDGVAGGARIMALKASSESGFSCSALIKAYRYMDAARESGVNLRVVNDSWGGSEVTRAIHLAVEELAKEGVLSVFASGNDGQNREDFAYDARPASLTTSLVQVNAMDYRGEGTPFTNWSLSHTTVYAPGSGILSTVPMHRAEYGAATIQDSLLYTGFEGGENPIGDRADVLDEAGNALSFFAYDPKTEETGGPIPLSEETFFGNHALCLELKEGEERSIVSSPITLSPQEETAYFSFAATSFQEVHSSVQLLAEGGSFSLTLSNLSEHLVEGRARTRMNMWDNFYGEIPKEALEKPFRIAFTSQAKEDTSLYLDGIGIGTQTHPYGLMAGTSMAAPMVTGAAALLFSAYPEETPAQISARITGGANRTESPSLSSTCISGGFLDLQKAFESPDPAVQQILDTGNSITLKGRFFGDAPGEASMGGVPVSVSKWTDEEITFLRPEGRTFSGMTEFSVTRTDGAWGRNFRMYDEGDSAYESLPLPSESPDYPESNMELIGNQYEDSSTNVAALGGRLYFTAGTINTSTQSTGTEPVTELWCYDIAARTWQRLEDLPKPILDTPSLCAWKGTLYLLGLRETGEPDDFVPVLYAYDPASGTWDDGLVIQHPYAFYGSLLNYREKLLLTGGLNLDDLSVSDATWELDPATGDCKESSLRLPKPLRFPNITTFGENRDQLLLAQFRSDAQSSDYTSELWWFDGKRWTNLEMPSGKITPFGSLGLGGGAEGVMITGIQNDPHTAQHRDTAFFQQGTSQTWEDVYFPGITYSHQGIAYDGYYYVLARSDELPENRVFKRIPLRTADASEEPLPTVTPKPELKKVPPAKDPVGDGPRKYGQDQTPRPKQTHPLG